MHAVILKKRKVPVYNGCQVNPKCYSYILCHVRKVNYKKGKSGEDGSDEGEEIVQSQSIQNGDEEMKMSKTGNKRGRPRKNPLAPVETHTNKSKRGRKPKTIKQYDFDPRNSFDVTFNQSEIENYDNSYDDEDQNNGNSPMGPIQKNLKLMDNNQTAFEGMLNGMKGESHQNGVPSFYPRKQSLENPFEKYFAHIPQNLDYIQESNNRSRRISSVMSPYLMHSNPPQMPSPQTFRGFNKNMNHDNKAKPTEDDSTQKRLNEIIAQSFNNWNNKPKRKETEDVDF